MGGTSGPLAEKMSELMALRRKMQTLVREGAEIDVRRPDKKPSEQNLCDILGDLERDSQSRLGDLRRSGGALEGRAGEHAFASGGKGSQALHTWWNPAMEQGSKALSAARQSLAASAAEQLAGHLPKPTIEVRATR